MLQPRRAAREAVANFLCEVKKLIREGKFTFIKREEYKEEIPRLGIVPKHEIVTLTTEDYYRGPNADLDRKREGDIWEFVKEDESFCIYIKLKIEGGQCKCLSMHKPKYPYSLPYKN